MNTEQIIKALECHISGKLQSCDQCPFDEVHLNATCIQAMCENALALIKEQGEQIFKLENRLKECENGYEGTLHLDRAKLHDAEQKIKEYKAEIERLNVVIKALKGEIEGFEKDVQSWRKSYAILIEAQKRTVQGKQELIAQIENLAKENKYLRESLADEREHKEDMEGK